MAYGVSSNSSYSSIFNSEKEKRQTSPAIHVNLGSGVEMAKLKKVLSNAVAGIEGKKREETSRSLVGMGSEVTG